MNHREVYHRMKRYREIRARSGNFGCSIHSHAYTYKYIHTHITHTRRLYRGGSLSRSLGRWRWYGGAGVERSPVPWGRQTAPYCFGLICLICLIRSMPILLAAASLALYLHHSTIVIHALPAPRARSRVSLVGRFEYIYSAIWMVFFN